MLLHIHTDLVYWCITRAQSQRCYMNCGHQQQSISTKDSDKFKNKYTHPVNGFV